MSDLRITGNLTVADHKAHVPLSFDVPPGVRAIEAVFAAVPARSAGALFDNLISLAVEAPGGFRGARHNNADRRIRIGEHAATPGFVAGPIEPGRWTVWLDVYRLLGPDPVDYALDIRFSAEAEPMAPVPAVRQPADRGRGWYRGDLHAHTLHSDGDWTPDALVAWALGRGLDFAALTDHNTASGVPAFRVAAGADLLALGGVELTTHHGHALVLGAGGWREWRSRSHPGVTMAGIVATADAAGETFVIAHPLSPGDPSCTGCRWEYDDVAPGPAGIVEVWNGPWSDYNEDGLAAASAWSLEAWSTRRARLAWTAGTDIHGPGEGDEVYGFNTVLADRFDEAAVIAAVRAGRNVLSSGPGLTIEAVADDGRTGLPGDVMATDGCTIRLRWSGAPAGAVGRLVDNGGVSDMAAADDGAEIVRVLDADVRIVTGELRDRHGGLLAVTNPIHLEPFRT